MVAGRFELCIGCIANQIICLAHNVCFWDETWHTKEKSRRESTAQPYNSCRLLSSMSPLPPALLLGWGFRLLLGGKEGRCTTEGSLPQNMCQHRPSNKNGSGP